MNANTAVRVSRVIVKIVSEVAIAAAVRKISLMHLRLIMVPVATARHENVTGSQVVMACEA